MLGGVTVALIGGIDRFEPSGPELLASSGVIGAWRSTIAGTGAIAAEDGAIILTTGACPAPDPAARCGATADQRVATGGAGLMVLTGEVTRSGVADAPGHLPIARIVHPAFDRDGDLSWTLPYLLDGGLGDSPWHPAEHGFIVDPDAANLDVRLQLAATSGELRVRGLSLHAARFRRSWLAVAGALVAVWLAVGVVGSWSIVSTADRKWAAGLAIALALAFLPLVLAPQGAVIIGLRDLAAHVRDHRTAAEEAPDDEPSLPRRAAVAIAPALDDDDVHVLAFVVLGWAATWSRRRPTVGIGLGLVNYAVATEAIQMLSVDRSVTFGDVGLDTVGAAIGAMTAGIGGAWRPPR